MKVPSRSSLLITAKGKVDGRGKYDGKCLLLLLLVILCFLVVWRPTSWSTTFFFFSCCWWGWVPACARRHRQPPMGSFVPDGQTNGINFIPFVCQSHSTTPHRSTLRFHVSSSSLGPRAPGDVHVVHVLIEPMVIIMSSLIDRLNIAISSIQLIGGDFSSSSSAAEDATSSRRRQT